MNTGKSGMGMQPGKRGPASSQPVHTWDTLGLVSGGWENGLGAGVRGTSQVWQGCRHLFMGSGGGRLQLWVRVPATQCLGAALELGAESPLRPSGDSVFNLFLLKTVRVI